MSSVVFVIDAEEQISIGAPWCMRLAHDSKTVVHVIVLGSDRKTLAEVVRRKLTQQYELAANRVEVERVDAEPTEVLERARVAICKTLLMIHRSDDSSLQQQLFELSKFPTVWLRANGPPPDLPAQVHAVFGRQNAVTSKASEQTLRITPASTLCDDVDPDQDDLVAMAGRAIEQLDAESALIVCGFEDPTPSDRLYKAGMSLMKRTAGPSIALVHSGDSIAETIANRIQYWASVVAPPMLRDQRIELAQDLETGSKPNLEFLGLMSAAAMLAAFGLLQNSAAVIIGAMLIAPLMTPILGAGLALTQGNQPLFRRSLWTIAIGFAGAMIASMSFGWLYLVFHDPTLTDEMCARSQPSPLDFCVGLVGGIAASYARTRRHLSSALAGAAIAAALVPPISTAGLQLAFRMWEEQPCGVPIIGPLLLVAVNVLTIMIGSSFVLWARGMRSERTSSGRDRWVLRTIALLMLLALLILIRTSQ